MATEGGGGATVEDPEGFRNRRQARRGTHVSVAGALVVGLIAAGSGVFGVWYGAQITAEAEDDRSDREFWRTERVEVYAEFLAATEESRSLIEGPSWAVQNYELRNIASATIAEYPAHSEEQLTEIQESLSRVDTLVEQISLLSEDVSPLAYALRDELAGGEAFATLIWQCQTDDTIDGVCQRQPGEVSLGDFEGDWWALRQFEDDRENFMEAAREDLDDTD